MGIRFYCPNGHKLNVKSFLAGKRGVCPHCGIGVDIPLESQRPSSKKSAASAGTGNGNGAVGTIATQPMTSPAANPAIHTAVVSPAQPTAKPAAQPAPQPAAKPAYQPAATSVQPATMPAFQPAPSPVSGGPSADLVRPATSVPVGQPVTPAPAPAMVPATAAPDPIAEAPNAVWYVRPPSGGQFGPANGEVMRRWIGEGRVSADSLVWREGWEDWQTAGPVFPSLSGGSRAAPAPPTPAPQPAAPAAPFSDPLPRTPAGSPKATQIAKRRGSNTLAVAVVIILGLLSIGLLIVFVLVASGQLPS